MLKYNRVTLLPGFTPSRYFVFRLVPEKPRLPLLSFESDGLIIYSKKLIPEVG